MQRHGVWLGRRRIAAIGAAVLAISLCPLHAAASRADWMPLTELSEPRPIELRPSAEKTAEAHALHMQALFEEELHGPDAALTTKKRVLFLDPGFTNLAVDVAQHHLRRGETPEAVSVLKDAKKAAPKDPTPSQALASIYLRHLQKPLLAEKHALEALEADPTSPFAYELLWEIHRASGQSRKIEPLFQRAERQETDDVEFWIALADLRLREVGRSRREPTEGVREKIQGILTRIESLGATNPEALARAGDFHALSGETRRAVELHEKALSLDPDLEGVREKLAANLVELGEDDRAVELLDSIIDRNPVNLPAYDLLARIQLRRGEFSRAASDMRQALLLAPIDPRRHEELIRTHLRAGDAEAAVQAAAEAESKFPYLVAFTVLRAISLSQAEQHAAALMAFERALVAAANIHPNLLDSDFYVSYGGAAERAGHYVKAEELLRKAIALAPSRSAEACNHLGYMWAELGIKLDEAEQLILRALEMDPGNGAYTDSLGWVYFKQGRHQEALTELQRAVSLLETPDPVVLDHLGDAHEKLGQISEAVRHWQKALELEPGKSKLVEKIDRHSAPTASQPGPR
ncbi:MAG: tetratricopeptide repeat protein [Verrucomicrobiota bacterium]